MKEYKKKLIEILKNSYRYNNFMSVPSLVKIVINMGLGKLSVNKNFLNANISELILISGQKPVLTYAKKSIANFKLRTGDIIGCKVTLRNKKMYEFLKKLLNIALPRLKDFKGILSKSFDDNGNYSIGIKEQIIFPEINYHTIERISGMDITLVTTAKNDEEGQLLLKCLGFLFSN